MEIVHVNLGPRSYDVAVVSGESASLPGFVQSALPHASSALIVADERVTAQADAVAKALPWKTVHRTTVPSGEETKSFRHVEMLYDALAAIPADRKTVVVAVGGGVVGDLAGFAAATYNRGLPLLMVPTTLLSMVDSSVGGKVGINHPKGKNLIGSFHQPAGVWIDTAFLNTLPGREYRSGLAEVVKYGVILDSAFFESLERNATAILARQADIVLPMIARCCRLKADVVEKDEREETGLRAVLNYGHTFAHAFEAVGGYGSWLHGEAVSAGMICASILAEKRGLVSSSLTQRQVDLLTAFQLPIIPLPKWPIDDLLDAMKRDKKNLGGKLRFILPTRLGEVKLFDDVAESMVRDILARS
ncbi:MAG: 3-dehydroquinate synthase [Gemmataceae bacterium]